ncbi:MAG TPA: response regulator [Reyranella sp.]|nr:response regulator [Reyranella sp.]
MGQVSPLGSKKVLIVEDDFLIAQDLRAVMRAAGYAVCGTVASSAAALRFLGGDDRPDGVLLDVNLSDRDASPVARLLATQGVPFLLVTAYERQQLPTMLRDRPCLLKPYSAEALVAMAARTFVN